MKSLPLLILSAVALVSASREALAFATDGDRWTPNRGVMMHLNLGGGALQDGFTSFDASAADALNLWNQHLVHVRFRWQMQSPLPPKEDDTDNSVFFSDKVYGESFGSNVLAVTLISTRDSSTTTNDVVVETDVIFNSAEQWDSYRGPQQASRYDFHRVALHEFGHVLGLDHPNQANPKQTVTAIMNSTIGNIDSLQQDDINGVRSLYDNGPAYLSSNPAPNLVNLSTRAFIGTGEEVMIGGFIIQGSQPATVVLRAIGNSLAARGVQGPNEDPTIELRSSSGVLQTNDDWVDYADAATIASYGLDPTNSRESAVIATLNPGSYTVVVRGWEDVTGVGLVELYDLHTTGGRAGNISTRARVGSGARVMVAGFIVGAGPAKSVVLRGLGPSLADAGVANTLPDPVLELRDSSGNLIRANDDWESDPESAAVRDSGLAPSRGNESALHVTLAPGSYTAVLTGFENGSGIALVEVYDLSPAP